MYTNSYGMSGRFGFRKPFFLERIDAVSIQGAFSTDVLAQSVGQITVSKTLAARSIVCDFGLFLTDKESRDKILNDMVALFNPLSNGVLKIETSNNTYEIDCYPNAVPSIQKNDNVYSVYRFTVDFICDYPYFRKSGLITKNLKPKNGYTDIYSNSAVDTPVEIVVPANTGYPINNNTIGSGFTVNNPSDKKIFINTKDFTVIDEDGKDVSNYIDATADLGDFYLKYGYNHIFCPCTAEKPVALRYYDYALGVV